MAPRMKGAPEGCFDPSAHDWSGLAETKKSIVAAPAKASEWEDIRHLGRAEKANLVITDFTAGGTGGALPPKAADQFIIGAVLQSKLLSMVNSDTYDVPEFHVPASQFAGQILYAGTQGQAMPAGQRSKPLFTENKLIFQEFRGQVRIDDGVFETQIERSGLLNTIMGQINIGVGRDIENAAINGAKDGSYITGNSLFTQIDGWLKKQSSNTLSGSSTMLDKQFLKRLWKTLPRQYRLDSAKMKFLTATDAVIDYVDTLANRIGEKADAALTEGDRAPRWNGVGIEGIPLFPTTIGTGNVNTSVLLADPKSLYIGFQRIVKLEQWRDPDSMQTIFSVSVKFDVCYGFEPSVALGNNVLLTTGS